jgi:RNA polymerase sigma-70 factor, ECF subfamily
MVGSQRSTDAGSADLDDESARWIADLNSDGAIREAAAARLHTMLLRVAFGELRRRRGVLRITGPELDDLAHQAAGDAVMSIIAKVATFRGESRFTTWAYRFVILEVSSKIGRHFWRHPPASLDTEHWERLPDRFSVDPAQAPQWSELAGAIRRAVDEDLTDRQRRVFVAIVLQDVPLDALVVELASNRNAIYKSLFDARRKLRAVLVANGYLTNDSRPRQP